MSLSAALARLTVRCARVLPPPIAWWLGSQLGLAFAALPGRERQRAREHLAIAFPDRDRQWVVRTVRQSFRHFGGTALWTLATLHRQPRQLARGLMVEGAATIRELVHAHRHGHSTMGFTGHFGNWELLARIGGMLTPLACLGRRLRNPGIDALVAEMRRGTNSDIIYNDEGPRPVLRALRRGRLVSVLVDQDIPRLAGVFVPWFGRLARTPVGAAQLALATGTPVMPAFLFRAGGRWVTHFGPRFVWPSTADREADAVALTAWITAYEEALVRRHPEQWVWWHKRWRSQPA